MNVVIRDYTKQNLDNVNLSIEAGNKYLLAMYDDIYALDIMSKEQIAQVTALQELTKAFSDDLIDVCEDIKSFLERMNVDSKFVDDIEDVIRMGGDLVDISIHYRGVIEESGNPEDAIDEIYGTDTDTEDIINAAADTTALVPPMTKDEIIEATKGAVEATKEAIPDVKTSSSGTPISGIIEITKDPGLVETAKGTISTIVSGINVDATAPKDDSKLPEIIKEVAGVAAAYGVGTAISAGSLVAGAAAALAPAIPSIGAAALIYLDNENDKRIANEAATNAGRAYIDVIANGGTRDEAKKAAEEAYGKTTYIPGVDEGVIHREGTTVADSPLAGGIDTVIDTIEGKIADGIRDAGGDVSDYFGGCGCDDACDCPDCGCDDSGCGSDCSSDCGCNDTGTCPDCPSDTPPCGSDEEPGCSTDCPTDCPSDTPPCASDCPSDCPSDCGGYCGSDYPEPPCGCDDCSSDSPCGCDDSCDYDCTMDGGWTCSVDN